MYWVASQGSRHGITVGMIRKLVEFLHRYKPGTLAMIFLNSSVEFVARETIRLIALKMKETGIDIHYRVDLMAVYHQRIFINYQYY